MSDTLNRLYQMLEERGVISPETMRWFPRDPGALLRSDLNLDSLDAIEIAVAIQEEFDVDVPDGTDPVTMGELAEIIDRLVAERLAFRNARAL